MKLIDLIHGLNKLVNEHTGESIEQREVIAVVDDQDLALKGGIQRVSFDTVNPIVWIMFD